MSKVIPGVNDLQTINPTLADEWDYGSNGNLHPSAVSCNSNKKVFWLGKCGHRWGAVIQNRNAGNAGCPFCSNKRVLPGFNDLATQNPSFSAQWNYERNGELLPTMVTHKSGKKVWWRCKHNHEWQATVNDRNSNHGCPYCAICTPGINDLLTMNPDLAAEWHPEKNGSLMPGTINAKSSKKVWWMGPCGHEWLASVGERNRSTRRGSNCPICNKGKQSSFPEQAIFYYLKSVFSDAINADRRFGLEFDVYIPSLQVAIEYDGYLWHSGKIRNNSDLRKNTLCIENGITLIRIRENNLPLFDNCLCIACPDNAEHTLQSVIAELLTILKADFYISQIRIERDRQKILSAFANSKAENSLSAKYPDIAAEWHPSKNDTLIPQNVDCHSGVKVWWMCSKCNYEWQSPVANRTKTSRKANGCPVCAGTIVIVGINDYSSHYPDIAKEWHPNKNGALLPHMITQGSHRKVWWLGKCGHEWEAYTHHRASGTSCPYCSNKLVLPGYNDLAATNPQIAAEWDHERNTVLPTQVTAGSSKIAAWICHNGHKYEMPISRRKRGSGCPYCAGNKVLAGYNDLLSRNPILASEWDLELNDCTPDQVHYNNQTLLAHWKCIKCGYQWKAKVRNRRKCPNCQKSKSN